MTFPMSYHRIGKYCILLCVYAFGPLFILTTNPEQLPLPLLVVPFIWLFGILFYSAKQLLKRFSSLSDKQSLIISGMTAALPVLLLLFQSIHQLTAKDVLLSVGLVGVAALYIFRADFIK